MRLQLEQDQDFCFLLFISLLEHASNSELISKMARRYNRLDGSSLPSESRNVMPCLPDRNERAEVAELEYWEHEATQQFETNFENSLHEIQEGIKMRESHQYNHSNPFVLHFELIEQRLPVQAGRVLPSRARVKLQRIFGETVI